MLTKEERNAIAERIGTDNTTWGTDCKVVRDRLIELCDTSNMVELPLDKDGEVIHIGDTVFDELYINMDKVVLIHRPSRTVCLDMVDGSGNGVVSLSEGSIDKLIDSIHVSDKPAKTVNVRTRLL